MKLTRARFSVPEIDCPSEEQTVRMAFQGAPGIRRVLVDLPKREVVIWHNLGQDATEQIAKRIPFRANCVESTPLEEQDEAQLESLPSKDTERRTLFWLLRLNFGMFLVEIGTGVLAQSSGLVADGLDMLADSLVYFLSLLSINLGLSGRVRATRLSAILQGGLGILAFAQAGWRFIYGSEPEPGWMAGISAVALAVNVTCLMLISRFRTGRMHMQASWIFSANDVIANLSVILAGALVAWTGSRYPDLIVGMGICFIVLRGALKIQKLASAPEEALDLD